MNTENKEEKCAKCEGKGWYQYSGFNGGTPHSKTCELCCTHEGTPWKAENGKYYCSSGCGKEMPEKAEKCFHLKAVEIVGIYLPDEYYGCCNLSDTKKDEIGGWVSPIAKIIQEEIADRVGYQDKFCELALIRGLQSAQSRLEILLARQSFPMGISQWLEHGKKYGYDKYLEKNLRAELVKEIEGKKQECVACENEDKENCSCEDTETFVYGWNAALDSIKNLINK